MSPIIPSCPSSSSFPSPHVILLVEEREEDEVSDRRAALGDVIGDTIGQGHDDNATNDRPDG